MKTSKHIIAVLLLISAFSSCNDDSDDPILPEEDVLETFNILATIDANGHEIGIYSEQQQFTIGYNELFIRIKEVASDTYVADADISWTPMMHMTEMMHSCPKSAVSKTDLNAVYKGFTIFQMPGNAEEYWELSLDYTIAGQSYNATERIEVKLPTDGKQRVSTFMGSDDSRYILAMMPMQPEVKVNDFSAMLFKMENMMTFPSVADYMISLDPRMPGMGNHSSPNNEDLSYDSSSGMYKGKLSLTMTGYWKINLKLMNDSGVVLKGEDITEENESSSLFFEIEF